MKKWVLLGLVLVLWIMPQRFVRMDPFTSTVLQEKREEGALIGCASLDGIVSQPLTYIGHGGEAIAFLSSDGEYVLKFFLKRKLSIRYRLRSIAKLWQRPHGKTKIDHSIKTTLRRYEQAMRLLPEETCMVAVYTAPQSGEELPHCQLIDYQGKHHEVDLNHVAFVVQRKGEIIASKQVDQKLYDLFATIAHKGFVSHSHVFNPRNFAILNGKAVMIDVGRLDFCPEHAYDLEEEKLQERYHSWLKSAL